MSHSPTSRRFRRGLLILGVIAAVALVALLIHQQQGLTDLAESTAAFEQDVGTLRPEQFDLAAEAQRKNGLDEHKRSRQAHRVGHEALAQGHLIEAVEAVEAIEALRSRLLQEPRLVELMLSQSSGRFSLDLATAILETSDLPAPLLLRLEEAFDPAKDTLGVDAALVYECEIFMARAEKIAIENGLQSKIYNGLMGPREAASSIRVYHGMAEAMREPILDISSHLRRRSKPWSRIFEIVGNMLIVNIQDVPLDQRYQTSNRRLLRLAVAALLNRAQTGSLGELEDFPAGDLIDAVTHGRAVLSQESDGVTILSFPGAKDHQATRPERLDTAPPAFSTEIRLRSMKSVES